MVIMKLAVVAGAVVITGALSLFGPFPARATDFTGRVIIRMQNEIDTMHLSVKGNRYLLQGTFGGQSENVLVDRASDTVDAWDPSEKEYHETTLDDPMAAFVDPFAAIEATKTMSGGSAKVSGTETIEGYLCDKYVLRSKDGMELMDFWVARTLNFPIKFVEPLRGGTSLELSEIKETSVSDSRMQRPSELKLAVEPGAEIPAWAGEVAGAPKIAIPFRRRLQAGTIVRIHPHEGEKIEVACQDVLKGTQFCAVPFKDGKPIENIMMDTFTMNPGDNWTKPFDPFSFACEDEFVVRMNKGSGIISIRETAH